MARVACLRLPVRRAVVVVAAVAVSCGEPTRPQPSMSRTDSATIRSASARLQSINSPDDRQCIGSGSPGNCSMTVTPANYFCDGLQCVAWASPEQRDAITGTFSKPVYRLVVIMDGRFYCSDTYGTVAVFNRRGAQVEDRGFTLQDPSDCGEDGITCCAVDTLQFPGGIGHVVVSPPQPWGDIGASYTYWFDSTRAPTVDSCLTGDEWLDQQAMRDLLKAAWDSSNANDAPSNRRETRGWLFEDSTGNLVTGVYPHRIPGIPPDTLVDGPCSSVGLPPNPEPGIRVARGHTHMFAPADTMFPPVCGVKRISGIDMRFSGPSAADIRHVAQDTVPGYIVERDTIRVMPLGTDTLNARSRVKRYPRVDPVTGCRRV